MAVHGIDVHDGDQIPFVARETEIPTILCACDRSPQRKQFA